MANMYGRQVVLPLVNKSGGGVVAGDVVIVDTGNDGAFTTTTTGQIQKSVGVVQETIANNATGRVLVAGYAALINVPSSMTRGNYIETHTVAKQATGSASRRAGSFGQFLTAGTTPTGWLWGFPDNNGAAGSTVGTDTVWDAAGDLVQGTGADTAAKLSAGLAGQALISAGAAAANSWKYPPGYEFDYVAKTTNSSITATTEAGADTVVTGSAVTYDGSTVIIVEFWANHMKAASSNDLRIWLYDGSSSIGFIDYTESTLYVPVHGMRRITPSAAAHTYSIRASVTGGTGVIAAGAGGNGNVAPMFIRQYKV